MNRYAQTNIQLFNQLQRDGYRDAQLRLIADAYGLAAQLFTARFEPSGKCFMGHVIGVASILGAYAASAELVAAGLVHNAYRNGDFGDCRCKITAAKRERIRSVIGENAEQYVYRFATRRWYTQGLREIHQRLETLTESERHVVLLYLADQLEKLLDLEILYRKDCQQRCEYYREYGPQLTDLAHKLGHDAFANELQQVLQETFTSTVPEVLRSGDSRRYSFLCVPESCRIRRAMQGLQVVRRNLSGMIRKKQPRHITRQTVGE